MANEHFLKKIAENHRDPSIKLVETADGETVVQADEATPEKPARKGRALKAPQPAPAPADAGPLVQMAADVPKDFMKRVKIAIAKSDEYPTLRAMLTGVVSKWLEEQEAKD